MQWKCVVISDDVVITCEYNGVPTTKHNIIILHFSTPPFLCTLDERETAKRYFRRRDENGEDLYLSYGILTLRLHKRFLSSSDDVATCRVELVELQKDDNREGKANGKV